MKRRDWLGAVLALTGLRSEASDGIELLEGEWQDDARQRRKLPWRIYVPAEAMARPSSTTAAPAASAAAAEPATSTASAVPPAGLPWVVFSHGLGGSRLAGEYWGRYWAQHGIASLHLQHAGSDRTVLMEGGLKSLQAAMNAEQLFQRVQDVRFALAEVARRAAAHERPWHALHAERIGIAGHSFGAVTTQALAGQRFDPDYAPSPLHEPRFQAALAFSPSHRRGEPARSFGRITMPFMSITGTDDSTPLVADVGAAARLLPFEGLPAGRKYLLVFDGASHASFSGSGEGSRLDNRPRATERVRPLIQQASTWFWQAHLLGDEQALQRLRSLRQHVPLAANDVFRAG